MRRLLACAALVAVAVAMMAVPADAGKPTKTGGEPFEAVIPFPDICDFQLEATVRGKTHLIEFDGGTSISAGQLKVTWTRLDGGGSRTFSIAGPTFTLENGTVMGTGRWAAPIEGTGWSIVTGNITFGEQVDPNGFALVVDYRGHATQICDLLA
jgi:hypothetical protein